MPPHFWKLNPWALWLMRLNPSSRKPCRIAASTRAREVFVIVVDAKADEPAPPSPTEEAQLVKVRRLAAASIEQVSNVLIIVVGSGFSDCFYQFGTMRAIGNLPSS